LGLSRDLAELLLEDLRRAILHLEAHPPLKGLVDKGAGGYHHA
jgi:glutamate decarboxylase